MNSNDGSEIHLKKNVKSSSLYIPNDHHEKGRYNEQITTNTFIIQKRKEKN